MHQFLAFSHTFFLEVISFTPILQYLVDSPCFGRWTLAPMLLHFHNFGKIKTYWHKKFSLRTVTKMQWLRYLFNYLFSSKRNFHKGIYQVFLICFSSKYFLDSLCKSVIHWREYSKQKLKSVLLFSPILNLP